MQAPPGCSRYAVELRKPLGLVLEEDRHGSIYVVRGQSDVWAVTGLCLSQLGAGCRPCLDVLSANSYQRAGRTWRQHRRAMRRL